MTYYKFSSPFVTEGHECFILNMPFFLRKIFCKDTSVLIFAEDYDFRPADILFYIFVNKDQIENNGVRKELFPSPG